MASFKKSWARQILGLSIAGFFAAMVLIGLLLYSFPWATPASTEGEGRLRAFTTYWPKRTLLDVKEEKKRLKRFAAAEQRRRLALQLRRMEFLNTTLVELDHDSSVQIANDAAVDRSFRAYEWPFARSDSERGLNSELVYLPLEGGFVLRRGIRIRAGDELKFSADLAREPRNLIFYAFPLSPGSIRGALGKYSFTNNFEATDVQKSKRIVISIGDSTATQFRLRCQVGEFFLLFPRVARFEQSGRIPVQLESGSEDWEVGHAGDVLHDRSDSSKGMVSPEKEGADETTKAIDPEDIESNPVHSDAETTVALGYNVLVIRRPAPERHKISRRHTEVERFYANAQRFSPIESSNESILGLLREDLASSFWKYGYHTVGFGPPDFFGSAPDLLKLGFGTVADSPWLSPEDAALQQKNVVLERSEKPAKGLEAIFDRQGGDEFRPLNSDAWKRIGFHQRVSQSVADSRTLKNFSEAYVLNPGGRYLADLVAAYQDWSEDQWQNRFFQVVDLVGAGHVDVSLQNLMGGLLGDFSNVFKVPAWRKIAREDGMERAFDQVIQSLRARRLLHRTVIVVLETSSLPNGRLSTRPYLMIPGLKARNRVEADGKTKGDSSSESEIVALRDAIRGAVGATPEESENLDEASRSVAKRPDPGFRVRLSFLPIVRDCGRIRWRSAQPLVGLTSKNIKTEGQPESGFIDMFPCSGAGSSWVSWSQSQKLELAGEPGKVFGGQLIEEIGTSGENSFALFYGAQMLSAAELRLSQLFSVDPNFLLSQSKFFVEPEKRLAQRLKDGAEELTKSLKFVGLIEAIPNHEVD
jgi:hypothetical protein